MSGHLPIYQQRADSGYPKKIGGVTVTSGFGLRNHPKTGERDKPHQGIDIAGETGSPMYATKPMTVVSNSYDYNGKTGYGNYVKLRDATGQEHVFAHLDGAPPYKQGDVIKPGEVIGHVGNSGGSTGSHLHYEVRNNGVPDDPLKYTNSAPMSFDKNPGSTMWNGSSPKRDPNRRPNGKTKDNQAPSAPRPGAEKTTPSDDPIGDLVRQKEEQERRKKLRDPNKQNSGRRGNQRPAPTSGSVFHRLGDGG